MTTTAPAANTARVIAAPGFPTDLVVVVNAAGGRSIQAVSPSGAVEEYTLRRNGKYALKSGGQWSNYLRFEDAA